MTHPAKSFTQSVMQSLPIDTTLIFFGNTVEQYLFALLWTVIALVIFSWAQRVLIWRLEKFAAKSTNTIDDTIVGMAKSIRPPFYWFLSLYIGLKLLSLPHIFDIIINGLMLAWVLYFAVRAANVAIEMLLAHSSAKESERAARHMLAMVGKGILWVIAILLLLSNLGINITSLIAGLGIGGVAIAFALQNILSDLFSSFAIYFDKPFEIGDFIIVGQEMGTVERIGIKTTRLRALQGEEIVISNRELTSVRVQNFKKMAERRIVMQFGITYETPKETVAGLSEKIKNVINPIENIRVDRVHFATFGDSALGFELVYFVKSGDYTEYMDNQQKINLALIELFEKEKVSFAYPTRMIYNAKA